MVTFVSEFVEQDSTKKKKGKMADDRLPLTFVSPPEKEPLTLILLKSFLVFCLVVSITISQNSNMTKINDFHYQ